MAMDEEEFGRMQIYLSLQEFLECFPPPQRGQIVEGCHQDFDAHEAFDIPRGTVLNFHRKVNPNVPLSFQDSWGGAAAVDNWIKVTLPLEFKGRFQLLPYDPISNDDSADHIYATAKDLSESFPTIVQANSTFGDKISDPTCAFTCGDRLKLIRLVYKTDVKYLECRLLNESRILLLPMDCVGNFTVVPDDNEYLLVDLVNMMPRRRRVRVISDSSGRIYKIPGLPANFSGDVFIEEPESFVEASPVNDSGLIIGLPLNLDLMIAPDDVIFERGQLLNTFATNNRNLFPIVARVTDWDEETSILENHFIKPGVELVIHGWTRQSKVLARAGNCVYAIPLTYQGKFKLKPKQFHGVSELEKIYPGNKVRVIHEDPGMIDFPLNIGDVIRIKRNESIRRQPKELEHRTLKCEKFEGPGRLKEVKLPLYANAVFEEVQEDNKRVETYAIRELVSFVTDQEVMVELIKSSVDQKNPERDLPSTVTLTDFIVEPAVYVSVEAVDAPAFHIPLRTLVYVTFVEQLEKALSPLLTKNNPKLSTLDRCCEILPLDVFNALRPQNKVLEESYQPSTSSHSKWTETSSQKGWRGGSISVRDFDIPTTHSRPPSVAGSDMAVVKSKGLGSKLKNKFRKHKSTENLYKSSNPEFQLSVPEQRIDLEFSKRRFGSSITTPPEPTPPPMTNGNVHVTAEVHNHTATDQIQPAPVQPTHTDHVEGSSISASEYTANVGTAFPVTVAALPPDPATPIAPRSTVNPLLQTSVDEVDAWPIEEPQQAAVIVHQVHAARPTHTVTDVAAKEGRPQPTKPVREILNAPSTQSAMVNGQSGGQRVQNGGNIPVSPDSSGPDSPTEPTMVQIPAGFALMPMPQTNMAGSYGILPQNAVPPGYMLVPVMPPQSLSSHSRRTSMAGSVIEEDEDEDYDQPINATFGKAQQFKVVIPPDGNLYHFSVKKMAEFLRQLKLEEKCIRVCLKEKIDGRKFSKMAEPDLEKVGLMHPVVVHFRKQTHKVKPKFML